jgi:drug/metabolite transporter (DMT)-like permease
MEKVDLRKVRCQAKVAGTVVTVAGAMLMTLYKGPLMQMGLTGHAHGHGGEAPVPAVDPTGREWFLGSLFVIIATLAWASLFILQAHTLKQYSAPLSLTTLICFVGTLQAIVVTFAMEHRPSVWTIGFDMNLLAAAYAVSSNSDLLLLIVNSRTRSDRSNVHLHDVQGIVTSSIAYYVQGLVIQKTGPVFASAFSPLMMIVVAVMGSFILAEKIFLGGVLGSVLIVIGLYSVLWGKHKETQEESAALREALPMAMAPSSNGDAKEVDAAVQGHDPECEKDNGSVRSSSNGHGASVV